MSQAPEAAVPSEPVGSVEVDQAEIRADSPAPAPTGYSFVLGDEQFKLVFSAPANKFQYFLQKLVGIKWLKVVA